ncbi:hypothetical protein TVAG_006770 [Trichomonas vaginalis G3]|uniref:RRM domain-containing protein n=1 Tax=Trichomonas vaginalis (strain ATCC PRA-98 / G3) TaxID=412133 RepID=A2FC00_TRIV3|nr:RNA-binding domain, RBD family-containing protein [Trichomonas vaginalis G3]EAX97546.1 hypothetical protein TVAG_006770 [Trichomonas vaginalis G3]KAI5488123.1 RNA-binding domain, RBD family-containing protein [Trichomonas vaginalis G3]|eukprot:XP_001310476.1 hypothetical protein [Trichomonas vaginalis G3]
MSNDDHLIVILPANGLNNEMVSALFSEFSEIQACIFEDDQLGNRICKVYYSSSHAPGKVVKKRNDIEINGTKLSVMKYCDYQNMIATKSIQKEEEKLAEDTETESDEADVSDSDNVADAPRILQQIQNYTNNASTIEQKDEPTNLPKEESNYSDSESYSDDNHRRKRSHKHHHHHHKHRHHRR